MDMKILHVIPDDKFWECVVSLYNEVRCNNIYVCVKNDIDVKLRYINTSDIEIVPSNKWSEFVCDAGADAVFFHSLCYNNYSLVSAVPKNVLVFWCSWGMDIYFPQGLNPPICPLDLYKPFTQKQLEVRGGEKSWYKQAKRAIKNILHYRQLRERKEKLQKVANKDATLQKKALGRIDYVSCVLKSEYELILRNKNISAKFFPHQYVSSAKSKEGRLPLPANAELILVGNSSDPSNNLIDVLTLMKQRGIVDHLYLPLAYGETWYREAVEKFVEKENIDAKIQSDMLVYNDYCNILNHCKVAIFGHIRQQAMGNIGFCLEQGTKVFLYKDSVAYESLKSDGYFVYSIEDDLTLESVNTPLTEKQKWINRTKELTLNSFEQVCDDVRKALGEIEKERNLC